MQFILKMGCHVPLFLLSAWLWHGSAWAQSATNATPLLLDGVAAEVGNARITIGEAMMAARDLGNLLKMSATEQSAQLRTLYSDALDELIARQLILQSYKSSEMKMQPWMVERRIESIIDEHFGGDRSRLQAQLAQERISFDKWRERMEEEMIVTAMRQQFVDSQLNVSPSEVQSFYATNSAAFELAGPVRVGMILLKREDGEEAGAFTARARKLHDELQAGADFEVKARAQSREDHASRGGDWGYVVPEDLFKPELVKALAALKPGAISAPLMGDGTCYIVRKIAERDDLKLPLEEAWPAIEGQLRRRQSEERFRAWIANLRQKSFVRIHPLP